MIPYKAMAFSLAAYIAFCTPHILVNPPLTQAHLSGLLVSPLLKLFHPIILPLSVLFTYDFYHLYSLKATPCLVFRLSQALHV